jgi:hypothetical protein
LQGKPVRLQIVCGGGQEIDEVQQAHRVERIVQTNAGTDVGTLQFVV